MFPPSSPSAQGANQMPPVGPTQSVPQAGGGAGGSGGAGGFDMSQLPAVMQNLQYSQGALQKLAQSLPPLSPFIAQFLSQLGTAVPNVIMAAGGGAAQSPGGPPSLGAGQSQGMGPGAPPMPPGM